MHKYLKTLTLIAFLLSLAGQSTGFAAEKQGMDDSQIPFYRPPSLYQDVFIPTTIAKPQSLRIHFEHLTTSGKQNQKYAKSHPWPWANYVMYGELQTGTGDHQSSRIIWVHYQYFPYFVVENGLFPAYRAIWNPYRDCVDIVFAQYTILDRIREGLFVELYEAKLTDDLHVKPEELIAHEPDFLPAESKPLATLHTDITHRKDNPFGEGIKSLHLLPNKNSLLLAFDRGYINQPSDYFRYTYYSQK